MKIKMKMKRDYSLQAVGPKGAEGNLQKRIFMSRRR